MTKKELEMFFLTAFIREGIHKRNKLLREDWSYSNDMIAITTHRWLEAVNVNDRLKGYPKVKKNIKWHKIVSSGNI